MFLCSDCQIGLNKLQRHPGHFWKKYNISCQWKPPLRQFFTDKGKSFFMNFISSVQVAKPEYSQRSPTSLTTVGGWFTAGWEDHIKAVPYTTRKNIKSCHWRPYYIVIIHSVFKMCSSFHRHMYQVLGPEPLRTKYHMVTGKLMVMYACPNTVPSNLMPRNISLQHELVWGLSLRHLYLLPNLTSSKCL